MPDQTDVVTTVATAGLQAFGLSGLALQAVLPAVVEGALATLPDDATPAQAENAAAVSVANFAASPHRTHSIRAEPAPSDASQNQLDALVKRFPTIMSLSPTNRLMLARQFENEQAAASRKPTKAAKVPPPSIADMERLHPDFSTLSPIRKLERVNGEIARRARGG